MRSLSAATFLIALVSSQAIAQNGFGWFVGGGPSMITQRGYSFLNDDPFHQLSSRDTVLLGGETGRGTATVGLARRLGSSALNLRLETTYQVATSDRGPTFWGFG